MHINRGDCQLCGYDCAIDATGKTSHHGYRVPYGYFVGGCPGSHELPLQVSCELVREYSLWYARKAKDLMDVLTLMVWSPKRRWELDREVQQALDWSEMLAKKADAWKPYEFRDARVEEKKAADEIAARKAERKANQERLERKRQAWKEKQEREYQESREMAPQYLAAGLEVFVGWHKCLNTQDLEANLAAMPHERAECGKCYQRCGAKGCSCLRKAAREHQRSSK